VSKYLFYALGEILLVVIGILIALQINNWNEERKNREKEKYYLNSIKTSIELSQKELNRVINDAKLISSCADTLFLLLAQKNYAPLEGYFLDSLMFSANDYSLISLNDGGIQELMNTGSLGLVQDERIRLHLASWDERMHQIRKFEAETEYLARQYQDYLNNFIDARRYITDSLSGFIIPAKKQALMDDPLFANYLERISGVHYNMHKKYFREKVVLDSLNRLINDYLSQ
jgi:hypothetical protein